MEVCSREDGVNMSKRFLLVVNSSKSTCVEFSKKISEYIISGGNSVDVFTDEIKVVSDADFAIVLGGDGTVIDTAAAVYSFDIPIACVNFGTLGYLSCCEPSDAFVLIDKLLSGDYQLENRTTIEGEVLRNGECIYNFMSVNDVSIHRGIVNSSLNFELMINDEVIDDFWSDGMLVSTPTGSTAYNLSAGGPVIAPGSNCMVVTQICAHSLNDCPIVISDNDTVSIRILNDASIPVLVSDHGSPIELKKEDLIFVRKGKKNINTIKINDGNFYSVLRRKISNR